MLAFDDLISKSSKEAIRDSILAELAALGAPVTAWKSGSVLRTLIAIFSQLLETGSEVVAAVARGGFLDYAEDRWLTLLADQVYDVQRREATAARTVVQLTNTGGGLFVLEPGDLVFEHVSTKKTYRSLTGGTLQPLGTLDVEIEAEEAGSESSAAAGSIKDLVTKLLGVTVDQPTAAVGLDAESDAELRARCREKLGSLSPNGPSDAYAYAAKTATRADGLRVDITRVRVTGAAGLVEVVVAGASGKVSPTDVQAASDAIFRWARPLCIEPWVRSASEVVVPVTYQAWVARSSGLSEYQIRDAVEVRLGDYFRKVPIGGYAIPPGNFFRDSIRSEIQAVHPAILRVEILAPAADITLSADEVAVLGTIGATVSQVDA